MSGCGEVQGGHGGERVASQHTVERLPGVSSRTPRRARRIIRRSAGSPSPSGARPRAAYHGGAVGIAQ